MRELVIDTSVLQDLRSIRLIRGVGQKDLATKAGVSLAELSKVERGLVIPDARFLEAVGRVLSVSPQELHEAQTALLESATPGEGYVTARSGDSYVIGRREEPSGLRIPVLDLFCGVGGFSHGFQRTEKFQVVGGIDLLPDRISTFAENHPTAMAFCTDIRSISIDSLAQPTAHPQVVIGGPPCQGFSSIRPFRTLTEKDPRNNLFEYFVLVVAALKPKWFVLENVVGLVAHDKGRALQAILDSFGSAGYRVDWAVLNAALYGLPQRRERLIVVGNSIGQSFRWPAPTHFFNGRSMAGKQHAQIADQLPLLGEVLQPAVTVMEAIHDLPEIEAGVSSDEYRKDVVPTAYERAMRGNAEVLTLHESTHHTPRMLEIIRQAGHNRYDLPEHLTSSGFSSSYSRLEPDLPSVTLTVNFVHPASNKCIHPYQDRALTPREGARLQGFEDNYEFKGTRSQIVKQIGNAVPPLLGEVIARALFDQW